MLKFLFILSFTYFHYVFNVANGITSVDVAL